MPLNVTLRPADNELEDDMDQPNLIIIEGQEGCGKSTTVRALVEVTPQSARLDAEDVGEVRPWAMTDEYMRLLHANVADVTRNFWDAGYFNVIVGSFITDLKSYHQFRDRLDRDCSVYMIQLCASRPTRDVRRIGRGKPTSEEWRDSVELVDPEDMTFKEGGDAYSYLRIDNDNLSIDDVLSRIKRAIPEIYEPGKVS